MSYRYAETTPSADEAHIASLVCDIVSARLHMSAPEIAFIRESPSGDIAQPEPILGLCRHGLKVYLLRGMMPRDLVRVAAHEVRHCKHFFRRNITRETRERDAEIFEHEFTQNLRGSSFDDLIAQLVCMRYAHLPPVTARQAPAPKPQRAQGQIEWRRNVMFTSLAERIKQIRDILDSLPNEPRYQWQRENLTTELHERLAQI